jgi:hypothetical protein
MKRCAVISGAVLAIIVLASLVACGGGDDAAIGCHDLRAGTKCSEHSVCSGNFLCLTGQGSDSDCTTSCSCQ